MEAPAIAAPAGTGFLHPLYSDAEREFGLGVLGRQAPSRETIAGVFRALRTGGQLSGPELRAALAGPGPHPLDPETAARCFRVLRELDLVAGSTNAGAGVVGVVSSEGTDLERSAAFRVYSKEHSEAQSFLAKPQISVEHSELLGDLFAVVEEFDSAPEEQLPAARRHRGRGGDDRPRQGRARLRLRLRAPRRPEALLRRRIHHPPGRGRADLRRDAARHRDALRGAAARHGRGHQRDAGRRSARSSARRSPRWSTASPS